MEFSREDEERFLNILGEIMTDENALKMKGYVQHGVISTYEHCESVARTCYILNKRLGERADMERLLKCAFLHDFYLYDWHLRDHDNKVHGFTHPKIAARNARKYFGLNRKEQKIIESHMWPLTFRSIPTSKEAWILCISDKYIAAIETIMMRKQKEESEG